jgi:hypothetical protein
MQAAGFSPADIGHACRARLVSARTIQVVLPGPGIAMNDRASVPRINTSTNSNPRDGDAFPSPITAGSQSDTEEEGLTDDDTGPETNVIHLKDVRDGRVGSTTAMPDMLESFVEKVVSPRPMENPIRQTPSQRLTKPPLAPQSPQDRVTNVSVRCLIFCLTW